MTYEKLTKAGINVDTLLNRLMGNASLVKLLVNKFITDGNYDSLVAAFAENDMQKAELSSHTLKGMCGNMSLDVLYSLFSEQVNLIRSHQYSEAAAMMSRISVEYLNAISCMRDWSAES